MEGVDYPKYRNNEYNYLKFKHDETLKNKEDIKTKFFVNTKEKPKRKERPRNHPNPITEHFKEKQKTKPVHWSVRKKIVKEEQE